MRDDNRKEQPGIPLSNIYAQTPEERADLAKSLKSVAESHKGKVNFATIDAKAFGAHAGNLNLPADKWPAFAIQETVKNEKYPFEGNTLNEKDIAAFVQKFVDGTLEASIKSEPIPEKQEGPVVVVVAHSYKDIVLDDKKDVLVEFYAPWCGHCKAYVSVSVHCLHFLPKHFQANFISQPRTKVRRTSSTLRVQPGLQV